MKTLHLVRHAKSDWGNQDLADIDRPLNERGYRDAHRMSKQFLEKKQAPQIIFSSPALRAMSTALIFCRNISYPPANIHIEEKIYEASIETMLHLVSQFDDRYGTAMIFGHNPVITDLTNILC